MFTVLFTDQSTRIVGYSIFRNGEIYKYGYFDLSKKIPNKDYISHAERRQYLIELINELIEKYQITHIVYEGVFYDNNAETYKKLSKVQGEIESYSLRNNITFEEFPITTWRSYLPLNPKTKRRGDIKKAVHVFVNENYPELKDEIEDVKESFSMGLAWIKKQEEMMEKQNGTTR